MPPTQETSTPQRDPETLIRKFRERFDSACRSLADPISLGPETPILLGCSAGGDSMALLDLAAHAAALPKTGLCVAHFDHAQREVSSAEAEFVEKRCGALGVAFRSERWGAPSNADSDEGSMREARLEFFGRVMEETRAQALLLAHQADDRAETFLMRLMRGSGPTGLGSIRAKEMLRGMMVVRPLLEFRREELRGYLTARGLSWKEDAANENERFERVWVRKTLLPLMNERMAADVAPRIVRASMLAEEESRALTAACDLILDQIAEAPTSPALAAIRIDHSLWTGASSELRSAILRQWLWKIREKGHPPGFETVREALVFAERGAPGTRHRTVERINLSRESGCLVAYPGDPE